MSEKVVGVIGGMGPEATSYFYMRLITRTPARRDQEHLRVIIDSNAKIPDRTGSILAGEPEKALEAIASSAQLLEEMGAELLVMPCNSAHYFYDDLIPRIHVPMLDMIEEVFARIEQEGLGQVGLLATTGTVRTGVYARAAGDIGLIEPSEEDQEAIHQAIYEIKEHGGGEADRLRAQILAVVGHLKARGAEGVILGCTELPLLFGPEGEEGGTRRFDSTEILVEATLREAYPRLREGPYS
ncbi:MAG: amino acid racemase [bacterium]